MKEIHYYHDINQTADVIEKKAHTKAVKAAWRKERAEATAALTHNMKVRIGELCENDRSRPSNQ